MASRVRVISTVLLLLAGAMSADGQVVETEPAGAVERFREADAELRKLGQGSYTSAREDLEKQALRVAEKDLKMWDANEDRRLELSELPDERREQMRAADLNGDGVITVEDMTAYLKDAVIVKEPVPVK